ncbi:uncharacterized protein A4U43_C07F37900 [Asparagus officinalis]|uniref:Uncharacterized protein n=1 Tax=Asparagus officinalis TaxID=4686 RepID=A0A5P1EHV1_ASPOF|nr:uncharacterized protein A4U43_C07F37900 [Asparagus officinalis]
MWSILMTADYAVVLLLIANGKLKRAISVLPHSIGVAVAFASQRRGSLRFIAAVVKGRMLSGVHPFDDYSQSVTFKRMSQEAPSWADQWSTNGGFEHCDNEYGPERSDSKGKKMASVKSAASAGLGKAKVAATAGANKMKSGTSVGLSWVKSQYQKRTSK